MHTSRVQDGHHLPCKRVFSQEGVCQLVPGLGLVEKASSARRWSGRIVGPCTVASAPGCSTFCFPSRRAQGQSPPSPFRRCHRGLCRQPRIPKPY